MSLQGATEFTNAIAANPTLMSEVAAATVGKSPAEAALHHQHVGQARRLRLHSRGSNRNTTGFSR